MLLCPPLDDARLSTVHEPQVGDSRIRSEISLQPNFAIAGGGVLSQLVQKGILRRSFAE
jgi:hypothetical protein